MVDALVGLPAVTGLVLAVIIRERHRARDAVERLVEERTRWLRSDRERLVAVQRLAKLGSLAWNVAGQTVDWSPEVLALHGRPETPVPPTWEDYGELVVPAGRQGLRMLAATAW